MGERPACILVTGATGHLGRRLVRVLDEESSGIVWSSSRTSRPPDRRWIGADLMDPGQALRLAAAVRPDVVFHLAGTVRKTPGAESEDSYEIHTTGTRNLMEALAFLDKQLKVFVVSSSGVYGVRGGAGEPFDESSPLAPANSYADSKVAQERIALSFSGEGFEVCLARAFNLIGAGQSPGLFARDLLDDLRARREEGRWWEAAPSRFAAVRDFLDALDAARALAGLASVDCRPEVVNLCSGRATHLVEVLEVLCHIEGIPFDPAGMPRPVASWQVGHSRYGNGWRPRMTLEDSLRGLCRGEIA